MREARVGRPMKPAPKPLERPGAASVLEELLERFLEQVGAHDREVQAQEVRECFARRVSLSVQGLESQR